VLHLLARSHRNSENELLRECPDCGHDQEERHVLTDEQAFVEEIQSRWNAQREVKPQQKKSDIKQL